MKFGLGISMILACVSSVAQVDFTASVNTKRNVSTDDQIRLEIKYKKSGKYTGPNLNDFHASGGQESWQGSHMVINGRVVQDSRVFTRVYVLQPKKAGKLTIGSAKIVVDGKTYKTAPITIEVSKGTQPMYGAGQFDPKKNLIAKIFASKSEVFKGEPLTLTYKIYTPFEFYRIVDLDIKSISGFSKKTLTNPNRRNLDVTTERINGKRYRVILLEKELLIPDRAGEYSLEPFEVEAVITSGWDFGREKVRSNPVNIQVKSLPSKGKPADFSGAVGQYELTAEVSSNELGEGEDGLDLKISLSGTGNGKYDDPLITIPPQFESFPPESDPDDPRITLKGMVTSDTINYFLVPQANGTFELGPFEFSYFDPESATYKVSRSQPIEVTVNNPNLLDEIAHQKKRAKPGKESKDLRYIKTSSTLSQDSSFLVSKPGFWVGLGSPLAAFLLLLFLKKRRKTEETEEQRMERMARSANKVSRKRLQAAKSHIDAGDDQSFYVENLKALYGYLSEKIGMKAHEMSKSGISETLVQKGVSQLTVEQYIRILEDCEIARYGAIAQNADSIYQSSLQVIENLEREI